MKKYPRSKQIHSEMTKDEPAYLTWSKDKGLTPENLSQISKATESYSAINRTDSYSSRGRWNQDLSDLDTNISGRPGLSKSDYYAFRPGESPKKSAKGQMYDAQIAYEEMGLVRNIIDLMADFACQGIRLSHPNKQIERFYQGWFTKVKGVDRSERFLNNLYRIGNVIIRTQTAKIKKKNKRTVFKTTAQPDMEIKEPVITKNEIPWKYTFMNPMFIDIVGGALASFMGNPRYSLSLPRSIANLIKSPKNDAEKEVVRQLPVEIVQAARTNQSILLPEDKVNVYYYKKDDWKPWASPMIHAIMDDLVVLEKLKLADMAALDGAISNIRIFKIGDLEHNIAPTAVAASKLAELLESNVGGGTMDLVWGPDIELLESKTTVHQFLGSEKYKPHLDSVYGGLGIPQTLTGSASGSGTTNNLIALKTLIGRLEYGRKVLQEFWDHQIKMVQLAMGFRFPATVEFKLNNLGDEAAEKALLIQLADRNLISQEMISVLFNHDPHLEKVRINRENKERNNGKMVPKAGPFHDPQFGIALKKVALQSGVMTPGQVGLRQDANTRDLKVYPKEKGEKNALELRQQKPGNVNEKKKGEPQQGRPKNSKDTKERKKRNPLEVKTRAIEMWASQAHTIISDVLNPQILAKFNKKNMRSLTQKETQLAEKIKFGVLCNMEPLSFDITQDSIYQAIQSEIPHDIYNVYVNWSDSISKEVGRKLTLDELRQIQSCVYANYIGENNG